MAYWICLVLVLAPLLLEKRAILARRSRLGAVVHVHGTRGKTGLTRATAAILRANGWRVLAKTTGDAAEIILPDGGSRPLRRFGPPRIREYAGILGRAARMKVDAVVVEGMALQPETIRASETVLRADYAVIANTRPDHAETMGPGRESVADALSLMIPKGQTLFIAGEKGSDRLCALAAARGSSCVTVAADPLFQSARLAEAVAARVLADHPGTGSPVSREEWPDTAAGASVPARSIKFSGRQVVWVDLFSANDVESSRLWLERLDPGLGSDFPVALLSTRADRPLRSRAFMSWLCAGNEFSLICPTGSHAWYAARKALALGARNRLKPCPPWAGPEQAMRAILREAERRGKRRPAVIGLGNAHGFGEKWRSWIAGLAGEAESAD